MRSCEGLLKNECVDPAPHVQCKTSNEHKDSINIDAEMKEPGGSSCNVSKPKAVGQRSIEIDSLSLTLPTKQQGVVPSTSSHSDSNEIINDRNKFSYEPNMKDIKTNNTCKMKCCERYTIIQSMKEYISESVYIGNVGKRVKNIEEKVREQSSRLIEGNLFAENKNNEF